MIQRRYWMGLAALIGGMLAFSTHVSANVNLELRPAIQEVLVGQTVHIRLYAVADGETDLSIGSVNTILSWNPDYLSLTPEEENEDNGPYTWLFSGFSSASDLNDTYEDGDAYYTAWMQLGIPATATPDGLLVTTLIFTALAETPPTDLVIIPQLGNLHSRVTDGDTAGVDVTGTLGSASVTILPCGFLGDLDSDCDVDLLDYADFAFCLNGPDGGLVDPRCESADLDGDGDVDLNDVGIFQAASTGP